MSTTEDADRLKPAVLSSSSIYPLGDLFEEVRLVSGVAAFDLLLLRDTDILETDLASILLPAWNRARALVDDRTHARIMAESPWERIAGWIIETCRKSSGPEFRIPALATYYPDVSSLDPERRALAVKALENTVRIALELARHGLMTAPIVEMVCGQILDTCSCKQCKSQNLVLISSRAEKRHRLFESCRRVIEALPGRKFALGLELEPGEHYVLNNKKSIDNMFKSIESDPVLADYIGMNIDIAHMRIAKVKPRHLEPYLHRIVHAHVADHPGMQTRDQHVGKYMPIQQDGVGGYRPYMRLLWMRARMPQGGLPFSGAIALELEGCNHIDWIHNSLSALKHLIESTR